jgi:hypothetical protein
MFFRENLFKPMCLFFSDPLVYEWGSVGDDELLAATITTKGAHFLEARRFLWALTLFYCHCSHLLNFSDQMVFRSLLALALRAFTEAFAACRALSFRSAGVMVLSLAFPPRLPIFARYSDTSRGSMA